MQEIERQVTYWRILRKAELNILNVTYCEIRQIYMEWESPIFCQRICLLFSSSWRWCREPSCAVVPPDRVLQPVLMTVECLYPPKDASTHRGQLSAESWTEIFHHQQTEKNSHITEHTLNDTLYDCIMKIRLLKTTTIHEHIMTTSLCAK